MYEEYNYYIGSFIETASFTFEDDCCIYWYIDFTEPLMMP